jgi:hypothetical protein
MQVVQRILPGRYKKKKKGEEKECSKAQISAEKS